MLRDRVTFDFALSTDAVFGSGRALDLPRLLRERGWTRPAVVVDAGVAPAPAAAAVVEALRAASGESLAVLAVQTATEPTYDYLDECAAALRDADCDTLVGIGGGSAMDLCKGIAILLTNPGRGIDYRGFDRVKEPAIPCALLPTTAGTGSEVTPTAVFIDSESRTKLGINGRHVAGRLAVLDPDLTASCPRPVAVGSGLDTLVHSLEAFMTGDGHPISRSLSIEAISLLFESFPAAVSDPGAAHARLDMLIAAYLAGVTLRFSGGGVAGALSYPLGAEFGVPHGIAGGVLVPAMVRANVRGGYAGYATLEARLGAGDGAPARGSEGFVNRMESLYRELDAPRDLRAYSVHRADIPHIVEQSIAQRSAVLGANPVLADAAYLTGILESVIPS